MTKNWTGDRASAYYTSGEYVVQRDRAAGQWYVYCGSEYVGTQRTLKSAKNMAELHESRPQAKGLTL